MIEERKRVVLATPTYTRPFPQFLEAVENSIPALDAAGIDHRIVFEVQNPYISNARANLLRKALDAKADIVVFIDHDMSWDPDSLVKLIQTPGPVVAGLYRYKKPGEPEEYMGGLDTDGSHRVKAREDGCLRATAVPAGFLKVTKEAVDTFMEHYPELCYGPRYAQSVDLFNHGVHKRTFYGEDMAFSRNWTDCGGEIWVIPDLDLTHHSATEAYPGNFHQFMMRRPGGSLARQEET